MDGQKFLNLCIKKVVEVANSLSPLIKVNTEDVFVVWSCKTLQHNKAMLGVRGLSDYYELTYNGDKKEFYMDVYSRKWSGSFKNVE